MDPKLAHADERNADGPPKPEPVQILRGDSSEQLREKLDTMVPVIERLHHGYKFCIGRPHPKGNSLFLEERTHTARWLG